MSTYQAFSKSFRGSTLERVLLERRLRWKLGCSVVLLTAAVTLFVYAGTGVPWPRPWYLFVVMAALTSVLALHAVWIGDGNRVSTWFSMAGLLMISWILRWTPLAQPMNTAGDQEAFLREMLAIAETNSIAPGGIIYSSAPFIIEVPQLWRFVADVSVFRSVIVTNFTSTLLPLAVFLFLREAEDSTVGWFGAVLSIPFALFLRSSVFAEAPSLALPWLVLSFYLVAKVYKQTDRRFVALLIGFVAVSSFIHPYYSLLTGLLALGALCLSAVESDINPDASPRLPLIGVVAATVLVIFRSQSVWGLAAVGASTFNLSGLIQDPIGTLYPSGGGIDKSLATSSSAEGALSNFQKSVLNLFQIGVLTLGSVIGGLYALYSRKQLITYSGALTMILPFLLLLRETEQAKYRAYYLIGVSLIIFSSIGFIKIWRMRTQICGRRQQLVTGVLILLLFSYSLLGPVSAVGNDIDPKIGGNSNALVPSDYEQISALDNRMSSLNVTEIEARLSTHTVRDGPRRLFDWPRSLDGIDVGVYHRCPTGDVLWDSGRFCATTRRDMSGSKQG